MSIILIITLLAGVIMIGAAIYTVFSQNILHAIIGFGVISLLAALLFVIMKAPDVAITEASIGSGLTIAVFLFVLKRIKKEAKDE